MYRQSEKRLLSSMCLHNLANFGPLTAEISSGVCSPQQIATGFASCIHCCSDVAQRTPTRLCTVCGHLLRWYTIYIHFRGLFRPDRILPGTKFTLRPSLAFACIGSITAQHSSSGRQPNYTVFQKTQPLCFLVITLANEHRFSQFFHCEIP